MFISCKYAVTHSLTIFKFKLPVELNKSPKNTNWYFSLNYVNHNLHLSDFVHTWSLIPLLYEQWELQKHMR